MIKPVTCRKTGRKQESEIRKWCKARDQ